MSAETDDSKLQADLAARRKMEREKQELLERARLIREEQLRQAELEKEERARRLEKEMELQKEEERKKREIEYIRRLEEQKRLEEEEAMSRRIALEERKIVIAQRKLESIRLLTVLFEQIRLSKMGDERERRMLEELLEARKKIERDKAEEEARRIEAEEMEKEKREQEEALRQMLMRKLTRRETPPPQDNSASAAAAAAKSRHRSGSSSSGEGNNNPKEQHSGSDNESPSAPSSSGRFGRGRGFTGLRRMGSGSRVLSRGVYGFGRQNTHPGDKDRFILTAHNFSAKPVQGEKGPVDPRLPFARRQQYVPMALRKLIGADGDQGRLLDVSGPEGAAMLAKAAAAMGGFSGSKKKGVAAKSKDQKSRRDTQSAKHKTQERSRSKKKKDRSRSPSSTSSKSSRSSSTSSSRSGSSASSRSYSTASSDTSSRSKSRSPSRGKQKKKQRPARSRSASPEVVQSKKAKHNVEPKREAFVGKNKKAFLDRKEPAYKGGREPEKRQRPLYSDRPQAVGHSKKFASYEDDMGPGPGPSGGKLKRLDRRYAEGPMVPDRGYRQQRDYSPPPSTKAFPGNRSLSSRANPKATDSAKNQQRGSGGTSKLAGASSSFHYRRDAPEPKLKSGAGYKGTGGNGASPPYVSQPASKRRVGRGIVASTSGGKSAAPRSSDEPRYTFFSHTR